MKHYQISLVYSSQSLRVTLSHAYRSLIRNRASTSCLVALFYQLPSSLSVTISYGRGSKGRIALLKTITTAYKRQQRRRLHYALEENYAQSLDVIIGIYSPAPWLDKSSRNNTASLFRWWCKESRHARAVAAYLAGNLTLPELRAEVQRGTSHFNYLQRHPERILPS